MSDFEYIIIGDTEQFKDCILYVCGKDKEKAEESLQRMLNSPTDNDKYITEGHYNLRVKEVPKSKCWWHDA